MDDHILERCYAIQNKHLSLDEAIEYQYSLGLKIAHGELAQQIYCANSPRCMSYVADTYQIQLYLEELRCSRNDIVKLKDEVKELRETNRRYSKTLAEWWGRPLGYDDELESLKAEVKDLSETKRRYMDVLRDCGSKDDKTIKLEDFIKAFYKHLEEYHNGEKRK